MASPIYTGFMYAASKDALAVNALVQASIQDHSEAIAFHCQQAAEKMVKAVFTENGQVPPKSHDIGDLLSTAIEQAWLKASQPAIQAAIDLTLYAVAARYETRYINRRSNESNKRLQLCCHHACRQRI